MSQHQRLPNFLVIGGMKCATTTMHQDLSMHPEIECGEKELNALTLSDTEISQRSVAEKYAHNYRSASFEKMLGDVSTTYTMLPVHCGVAEKAMELIGPELKLIFIARNPVLRTISHHQHMMNQVNGMTPDINEEITKHSELIAFSQYARQLTPWIDAFSIRNLKVVKFEDYVGNRQEVVDSVIQFLGLESFPLELAEEGANRTGKARVAGRGMKEIIQSRIFQNFMRPMTPAFARELLKPMLLKQTVVSRVAPSRATIDYIIDGIEKDQRVFCDLVGWPYPAWDFETIRFDLLESS